MGSNFITIYSKVVTDEYFLTFLWWGVVSISLNPQARGPLPVGCPRLLIQYIRVILHIGGSLSIRNLGKRHAVEIYW